MDKTNIRINKGIIMQMNEQIIELIQAIEPDRDSGMIRTQKQEMKLHTCFFDEEIGRPSKYRDLIHLLGVADSYDQFVFMINSPGGDLSATLSIIEAIKSTEANVRAVIFGECHSAASIIALNCHQIVVSDSAIMMVHTAGYSTGGNTSSIQRHVDFSTKMINRILDNTYIGFLSDQELKDIKTGVELWFDAKDIGKRLTSRMKIQQAKIDAKLSKKKPKEVVEE